MIKHMACMMDGNRRWATQQGLPTVEGHRQGIETVKLIIKFALEQGIEYLSLYTFSIENFKRSEVEKNYLFNLIIKGLQDSGDEFVKKGICVRFIGDRNLFPAQVIGLCERIEQQTVHETKLNLNFLFCYGSRQEIVSGIKKIAHQILEGTLGVDQISESLVQQSLWTANMPEPDIVIRPGGVMRLSNFLLYQSAYSEYYFLDCLWPDVQEHHLKHIVEDFSTRQRRFGS